MGCTKIYQVDKIHSLITDTTRPTRKHCNADTFVKGLRKCFLTVPDGRQANKVEISMADTLMSAFAMFSLKDQSLLAFDRRRQKEPENLHTVFGIKDIACDSQMREILDPVTPDSLQSCFQEIFRILQRGKDLEPMTVFDGHYLVSGDGTGFYSSSKISSDDCLQKKLGNGKTIYHQQMYAAAIVHPEHREVIPFFPEMITPQDGSTKQDCEREASRRFYREFRRIHPHLKVIVVKDGLSSNGPHIRDLQELGLHYILGAKPGDHQFLFDHIEAAATRGETTGWTTRNFDNSGIDHSFRFINGVPLNKSNQDLLVNVLEYWETDKDEKMTKFSWVTDMTITRENAFEIMRAGRARWKIENETFNTLKNQGYNLGHNYGLGEKHLGAVFAILMMLAFLVDQAQQLSCWLFRKAWKKAESKRALWEEIRHIFHSFPVDSMETILRCIAYGIQGYRFIVTEDIPTG